MRCVEQLGRYRLVEEVARGGMGAVFRAQTSDGRLVALKLLHAGAQATPYQRGRFRNEVEALMRVRHPGVVRLVDAGEHLGAPWLCLEWVDGETMAARLGREGWYRVEDAIELIAELCLAVEACHAEGVLHRDLKPENVLLRAQDGAPLLTDFGLARQLTEGEGLAAMTRTGQWLGTPGFWAPEQALGRREEIGARTDVYGLGALLYAALTGRAPHDASTIQEHLRALEQPPRAPGRLRPALPAWLEAECLRALARAPAERHESPGELRRALLGGLARPGPRRRRRGLALLGALGAAAGAGGAAALRLGRPTSASADVPPPARPVSASPGQPTAAPASPGGAGDASGHLARARALRLAHDLPGALAELDAGLARFPDDVELRYARAVVRHQEGDFQGAEEDLVRGLERAPTVGKLHALLAAMLASQGQLPAARRALERGIACAPTSFELHMAEGEVCSREQDGPGAARAFTRAIELAPAESEPYLRRAMVFSQQLGEPARALPDIDRALELEPQSARSWAIRSALRRRTGDLEGAEQDAEQALALDERNAEAWVHRGLLRRERGDLAGALADMRRGLELASPGDGRFRQGVQSQVQALEARLAEEADGE